MESQTGWVSIQSIPEEKTVNALKHKKLVETGLKRVNVLLKKIFSVFFAVLEKSKWENSWCNVILNIS